MPARKLGASIVALSIGLLAAIAVPVAASAHDSSITGTQVCAEDGQTRTIVWQGSTTNVPAGASATPQVTILAPTTGSTVSAVTPQVITGNVAYSFTQVVPGDALAAKVKVTLKFPNATVAPEGDIAFTGPCKVPDKKEADAWATSTPGTCTSAGSVEFHVTNAEWENTTDITDGNRLAMAKTGFVFDDNSKTKLVTYTIPGQLDADDPKCVKAEATASATSTPGTCTSAGSVEFHVTNAEWENTTDITDGKRLANAKTGFVFEDGKKSKLVIYTIPGQIDPDADECATAGALASVSTTPATCAAPGTAAFSISNATWDDAADITDGSRTATALAGHRFADGSRTATVSYSIPTQLSPNSPECLPVITPRTSTVETLQCESSDVLITTTTTTPTFTLQGNTWVQGADDVQVTTSTRVLTAEETEDCPSVVSPPTTEKKDVCPNMDGDQRKVPENRVREDGKCVVVSVVAGPKVDTPTSDQLASTGFGDELAYLGLGGLAALLAGAGILITRRVRAQAGRD
jgi:LPXTG-motif cell wall-anchored protein